jgi:hypothetical protein
MAVSEEYRGFAEACLRLAESVTPEARLLLVTMAGHWHKLAQERGASEPASDGIELECIEPSG